MATIRAGCRIDQTKLNRIVDSAKRFALVNGHLMRRQETPDSSEVITYAPFTLFPTVVPRTVMESVRKLQVDFNTLMYKVGNDHEFLQQCFQRVIEVDDFTKKLWDIYLTIRKEGPTQKITLTIFRNDFMMVFNDDSANREHANMTSENVHLKQIENNTFASGSPGWGYTVAKVHRLTLRRAEKTYSMAQMPDNDPGTEVSKGIVKAWEMYNKASAAVMFFIDDNEMCIDHFLIEKKCFEINNHMPVIYKTFSDVIQTGKLTTTKELLIGDQEVAVIYFRHGYSPLHYKTQKEWDARLMMERSKAIKCPAIQHYLAGCKKVQQVLASPGVIETFLHDKMLAEEMRTYFASLYSLDEGAESEKVIEMALDSPHKYVLKPQREGGGNNLYDEDLKQKLISIRDKEERSAYILMERIFPCQQKNYFVKSNKEIELEDITSEIGIYGVVIGKEDDILENREVGHVVKSKSSECKEGGINKGGGHHDSVFLAD